jgi:hypothetical protein
MFDQPQFSSFRRPPRFPSRSPVQEFILKSGQLQGGASSFLFLLKENSRGRFLRITEKTGEHFAGIIIPVTGLPTFGRLMGEMVATVSQSVLPPPASLTVERKVITLELRKNSQGRFLHLVETGGGHANELAIPADLLVAFAAQVNEMIAASDQSAPLPPPLPAPPRAALDETILATVFVPIERKSFMLLLKDNRHGRFLRITEKSDRNYACVFFPADGLKPFGELLAKMIETPETGGGAAEAPHSPLPDEITLSSAEMHAQEKTFVFQLKANRRGRYLRVIEEAPGCAPAGLIIPATGLAALAKELARLIAISDQHPLEFFA